MNHTKSLVVQQRLFTTFNKNLPAPLARFLITGQGKYMQLNPQCPHCGSRDVVQDGYYRCEDKLIQQLGLEIRHGHYLCKACGKTFSTPFAGVQAFVRDVQAFLQETIFQLFQGGMSFGGIATYAQEQLQLRLDEDTARLQYRELALSYQDRKVLTSSGLFQVDCQYLTVNREQMARLTVIDAVSKANIVEVLIPAETTPEVVDRLRLHLLPYEVRGFVVDGKSGLAQALKEEFGVPVQRCLFHVQMNILEDYLKAHGKKLSLLQTRNLYLELTILMDHDAEMQFLNRQLQRLDEFGSTMWCPHRELRERFLVAEERRLLKEFHDFRASLKRHRRKNAPYLIPRTEEEMRRKLEEARLFLFEKHQKKRLDRLEEDWEALTAFLHLDDLPPTNNGVEHYYAETLTKTDKKRFRSLEAIKTRIAACRAKWNGWVSPSVTLVDILRQFAQLAYLFGKPG